MTNSKTDVKVNKRFVVKTPFRDHKTHKIQYRYILNAEGYVDCAHQIGFKSARTEILDQSNVITKNDDGSERITRWATVRVHVVLENGAEADGVACVHSLDQYVKQPGYELAVAETRALKRAISTAGNINEVLIDPEGSVGAPTREMVGIPLEEPEEQNETEIPDKLKKSAEGVIESTVGVQFDV